MVVLRVTVLLEAAQCVLHSESVLTTKARPLERRRSGKTAALCANIYGFV